jgi:hypothetical protein
VDGPQKGKRWAMARGPLSDIARGSLAGAAATAAMSAVMLAAGRVGRMGGQPPEAIVRRVGQLTGREPQGRSADALASAMHLAFGVGTGALYGLLPAPRRPVARGVLTGLAVYTASYAGWVPALGALPEADHDRRDRQTVMTAAHVVYGAVLGALDARWRR